ncbi:MAG: family 78 glycoside hydrolase catalytic domain, partial [Planctomycetes bacterium]|nr:family 78 glycoside hydrolase catalytic domain [Planctomycetota bacterium]
MRYLIDHDPSRFFTGGAAWCWSDEGVWDRSPDPRPIQVRWFARTVAFTRGGSCVLAISADTRYALYVNGALVARGPQKGDVAHQFYDALDLSDDLRDGDNLLLVRVDSSAKSFPYYFRTGPSASEMSAATVFVADGWVKDAAGATTQSLASGPEWRVRIDDHLDFRPDPEQGSYVGYKEHADLGRLPRGFHGDGDLANAAWKPATVVHPAFTPANALDAFLPHRLMQRSIAPLTHTRVPFAAIRALREGTAVPRLVDGALAIEVAARSRVRLVLDTGVLRTAYPVLRLAGGNGARIQLKYAETCLVDGRKAHRDLVDGAELIGYSDTIIAGGDGRWTPLMWRTMRYCEVTAEAGDEALTIAELSLVDCHYPIVPARDFRCSDAQLERLWAVGLRTQQACAHETYEDCPYYEQLQYAGDTQMQMLYTYAVSGETRLPLQAIRFFHWSMLPEGITQSRYPSRPTQVIPFWSLHWLMMLWDWWRWTGDTQAIRGEILDAVRTLRWFLDRRDASGLVGALPYWCVADWSPEWCARFGGNVPGVK